MYQKSGSQSGRYRPPGGCGKIWRKKRAVGGRQSAKSKSEVRMFDELYTTCAEHDSESNKFSRAKNHRLVVRNLYSKFRSNLFGSLEEIL
jgi:hypothetical protein